MIVLQFQDHSTQDKQVKVSKNLFGRIFLCDAAPFVAVLHFLLCLRRKSTKMS